MMNFIKKSKEVIVFITVVTIFLSLISYSVSISDIRDTHSQCIENNQQIRTYSKQIKGDTIYYVLDYDCFKYEIKHVEYKEFERDAYWSFEAFDKYGQHIKSDYWKSDLVLNLLKIDCQNINQ